MTVADMAFPTEFTRMFRGDPLAMGVKRGRELHEEAAMLHDRHAEHAWAFGDMAMARRAQERARRARERARRYASEDAQHAPGERSNDGSSSGQTQIK